MTFIDFHDAYLSGKTHEKQYVPGDFRIYDQEMFVRWFLGAWPDHASEHSGTILAIWRAYISGWVAGTVTPSAA